MKCDWPNAAGFNIGRIYFYFKSNDKVFNSEKAFSKKFMINFWQIQMKIDS